MSESRLASRPSEVCNDEDKSGEINRHYNKSHSFGRRLEDLFEVEKEDSKWK